MTDKSFNSDKDRLSSASKATLHILNKSPSEISLYTHCFNALKADDAILFIESAVYSCQDSELKLPKVKCYLLQADLEVRGITPSKPSLFETIDDDAFVNLCCTYQKTISWF